MHSSILTVNSAVAEMAARIKQDREAMQARKARYSEPAMPAHSWERSYCR